VPAFVDLGAPHWDAEARGALFGLTRGTGLMEYLPNVQDQSGLAPENLTTLAHFSVSSEMNFLRRDQARSKRSRFITLSHAATKSFTNLSFESAHA
jgi:hypothetical protein